MAARAAADIVRFLGAPDPAPLVLAHRARCAAAILALPAAEIDERLPVRFP
jgi:hypothetical protein